MLSFWILYSFLKTDSFFSLCVLLVFGMIIIGLSSSLLIYFSVLICAKNGVSLHSLAFFHVTVRLLLLIAHCQWHSGDRQGSLFLAWILNRFFYTLSFSSIPVPFPAAWTNCLLSGVGLGWDRDFYWIVVEISFCICMQDPPEQKVYLPLWKWIHIWVPHPKGHRFYFYLVPRSSAVLLGLWGGDCLLSSRSFIEEKGPKEQRIWKFTHQLLWFV